MIILSNQSLFEKFYRKFISHKPRVKKISMLTCRQKKFSVECDEKLLFTDFHSWALSKSPLRALSLWHTKHSVNMRVEIKQGTFHFSTLARSERQHFWVIIINSERSLLVAMFLVIMTLFVSHKSFWSLDEFLFL